MFCYPDFKAYISEGENAGDSNSVKLERYERKQVMIMGCFTPAMPMPDPLLEI